LCAAFDKYVIDFLVDRRGQDDHGGRVAQRAVRQLRDRWGGESIADVTMGAGTRFRRLQTGSINGYLYVIVVGVVAVMLARLM